MKQYGRSIVEVKSIQYPVLENINYPLMIGFELYLLRPLEI